MMSNNSALNAYVLPLHLQVTLLPAEWNLLRPPARAAVTLHLAKTEQIIQVLQVRVNMGLALPCCKHCCLVHYTCGIVVVLGFLLKLMFSSHPTEPSTFPCLCISV